MAYTRTTWATGDTITATKLNNLETGVTGIIDGTHTFTGSQTIATNLTLTNGTLTVSGTGDSYAAGNWGVGQAPLNSGSWARVMGVYAASAASAVELSSGRTDAADAFIGGLEAVFNTNSASHKRIANIAFLTAGTTANQRGGAILFYTKADGSTALTERGKWDDKGNLVVGVGVLATTATDGFIYASTSAGAPTGVPTTHTGRAPIHVDTSNNRIYTYYGGSWRYASLT